MQNIVYQKGIVLLFLHYSSVCSFVCIRWMCVNSSFARMFSKAKYFLVVAFFLKSSFQRFKAIHSFENVLPDLKVRLGRQVRHVTNTSVRCSKTISKQKPFKRQNERAVKKIFNRFLSEIIINCYSYFLHNSHIIDTKMFLQ